MAGSRLGFLIAGAAALLAGCFFDPQLGRGRIACATDGACPGSQVCGGDDRCYPPGPLVHVRVSIEPAGGGQIVSSPAGLTCDAALSACEADLPAGVPLRLAASSAPEHRFSAWTGCTPSADDRAVCLVTPGAGALTLAAGFGALGGQTRWAVGFGGPGVDESYGVTVGAAGSAELDGAVRVAGGFASRKIRVGSLEVANQGVGTQDDALLTGFALTEGTPTLATGFSDLGAGFENFWHVASDNVGSLFFGGYIEGTVDFGTGAPVEGTPYDAVVVGHQALVGPPATTKRWARRFPCSGEDEIQGIATDLFNNVFVTGSFSHAEEPGCYFGSGDPADPDQAGLFARSDEEIPFVVKLAGDGTTLWLRSFPITDGFGTGIRVATTDSGDVVVVGQFHGTFDEAAPKSPTIGSDGELEDGFVVRLDGQDGSLVWAYRVGGPGADWVNAVATDFSGSVYVTGRYQETVMLADEHTAVGLADVFVLKLSAGGIPVWDRVFGGAGDDIGYGIAVDYENSDEIVVAGQISGTVDFGGGFVLSSQLQDAFVARYPSKEGQSPLWARRFGGPENDTAYDVSLAYGYQQQVLVVGSFRATGQFGAGRELSSVGLEDTFVLALSP